MVKFEISIDINKPPSIVDKALMKPENWVYWTTNLKEFEVVSEKPGKVGSVARLHYVENGKEHIMEDILEYADPGKKYISRVSGPALSAKVTTNLEPIKDGTRLSIAWEGNGKKLIVKILLPILGGKIKTQAQKELTVFKNLIETYGEDFTKSKKR